MTTTNSREREKLLSLAESAALLHVNPERITRLKELGRLKLYGKKGTEGEYCKLSELQRITHNDIMDAIYGPLGDEESEEGALLTLEVGGGRWR